MDGLFFLASKVVWVLIKPETWLLFFVLLAFWKLRRGAIQTAKRIVMGIALALVFIGFVPLGDMILRPLETRFPVKSALSNVDGIIILGGPIQAINTREWGIPTTGGAAERLSQAVVLARQFPEAKIVFTGGSGSVLNPNDKGGPIAFKLLTDMGISPDRLVIESASRNTFENAILTKEMVQPEPDQTWVLVTSAFHMPRSVGIFQKQNWQVIPYPVDHRTGPFGTRLWWDMLGHLKGLDLALHEWVGIAVYVATGKADWVF